MRVLLINPPYDIKKYMGKLSEVSFVYPPIGLLYIAGYLREQGHKVFVYDTQVQSINLKRLVEKFKPDIVGITCQTALIYSTFKTAEIIKKIRPDIKIVAGGVHPSIRPDEVINNKNIDYLIRGEGEISMHLLTQAVEAGKGFSEIPGLSYKEGKKNIHIPEGNLIKNLDDLPYPAWDLVPLNRYRISPDLSLGDKFGVIITARGCPFRCAFCADRLLSRGIYRARSIDKVMDEIEFLLKHHKIDQLLIQDDNFVVNKKRTIEFCKEFIRRKYHKKFTWFAEVRVDCVNEEILRWMHKAGCRIVLYGIESGVQRLLDLINKDITLEQSMEAVRIAKKVGMDVRGSLILGLPTETREESRQTIKFARKLKLDQVRFSLATPFPGTKLWDIAVKEGRIKEPINWLELSLMAGYTDADPLYYPKGRDPKELKRLQKRANLMFYLRPKTVILYLRRIDSWNSFKRIVKGFIQLLKATFTK